MTTNDKVARRKLSLLQFAQELDKRKQGLVDRLPGLKEPHPNRVPKKIESLHNFFPGIGECVTLLPPLYTI